MHAFTLEYLSLFLHGSNASRYALSTNVKSKQNECQTRWGYITTGYVWKTKLKGGGGQKNADAKRSPTQINEKRYKLLNYKDC